MRVVQDHGGFIDVESERECDFQDILPCCRKNSRRTNGEVGNEHGRRRNRSVNLDVIILLSSGNNHDEQAQRLLKEGVVGFPGKPYQVGELLETVRHVLDRRKND